jgi:hypothetical protein
MPDTSSHARNARTGHVSAWEPEGIPITTPLLSWSDLASAPLPNPINAKTEPEAQSSATANSPLLHWRFRTDIGSSPKVEPL